MNKLIINSLLSLLCIMHIYGMNDPKPSLLDLESKDVAQKIVYTLFSPLDKKGKPRVTPRTYHYKDRIYKVDTSRLDGAKKISAAIKKHTLNLLLVPEQKECIIPTEFAKQFPYYVAPSIVIAPFITSAKHKITKKHVEQIITLTKETGYVDSAQGNLLHTQEDTIAFVDTEKRGFSQAEQTE
jgi:hypothetical protein